MFSRGAGLIPVCPWLGPEPAPYRDAMAGATYLDLGVVPKK